MSSGIPVDFVTKYFVCRVTQKIIFKAAVSHVSKDISLSAKKMWSSCKDIGQV